MPWMRLASSITAISASSTAWAATCPSSARPASYDAAWRAGGRQKATRLIRYLWKNAHDAVRSGDADIRGPCTDLRVPPVASAPDVVVQRTGARYQELPEEFVPDAAMIGEQSKSSKQARVLDTADALPVNTRRRIEIEAIREHRQRAFTIYRNLSRRVGHCELARSVLPVPDLTRPCSRRSTC